MDSFSGLVFEAVHSTRRTCFIRSKTLNLIKHCCSFTKLHIKVFFTVKTYFSARNGIVTNRSKT